MLPNKSGGAYERAEQVVIEDEDVQDNCEHQASLDDVEVDDEIIAVEELEHHFNAPQDLQTIPTSTTTRERGVSAAAMHQSNPQQVHGHRDRDHDDDDDYDDDVAKEAFDMEAEIANTPLKWYETTCARAMFYIVGIMSMFPWGTVVFIIAILTVVEVEHKEQRMHPATHTNRSLQYQHMAQLDSKMYLYWNNPDVVTESIDMHVVYYGIGWVALGLSPTVIPDVTASISEEDWSAAHLEGSEAVIGLPLKAPPVQLYEITSPTFSFDTVHVKPQSAQGTIHDTLLVQSSTKTELSFIKDLGPKGDSSTVVPLDLYGENTFLFAYGASNALGHVLDAGAFTLDFDKYADAASTDEAEAASSPSSDSDSDEVANSDSDPYYENENNDVTVTPPEKQEESDIYIADDGASNHHYKNKPKAVPQSQGQARLSSCVASQDPAYQYTLFPTEDKDEYFFSYRVDVETGLLHGKLAYHEPQRWLGWGISPDGSGHMVGSRAIIGFPLDVAQENLVKSVNGTAVAASDNNEFQEPPNAAGAFANPGMYYLSAMDASGINALDTSKQTLIGKESTIHSDPKTSTSVMTFTKLLKEADDTEGMDPSQPLTVIWAVGSSDTMGYHKMRGSFDIVLSSCTVTLHTSASDADEDEEQVEQTFSNPIMAGLPMIQKDHKVMALLYTHGILMTLCFMIVTPISVSCGMLRHMPFLRVHWFYMHMGLNLLGLCLSIAAFFCALAAIHKGGVPHFYNTHQVVGLVIFVLITFQVTGALFRPKRVGADTGRTTGYGSRPSQGHKDSNNNVIDIDLDDRFGDWLDRCCHCTKRGLWQKLHEYNGTLILVLGLVQVHDGMDKLQTSYGVTFQITALFWAFVVPWAVMLFLMLWIQKGRIAREKSTPRGDILPGYGLDADDDEEHDLHMRSNLRMVNIRMV
jgi:hypothetical protein